MDKKLITVSNKLVKATAGRVALGEGQVKGGLGRRVGQMLKVLDGATFQVGDVRNFGTVLVGQCDSHAHLLYYNQFSY